MIQCKDLKYERYTIERYRTAVEPQIARIKAAADFEDVLAAREQFIKADSALSTMSALAAARYTLDTRDKFYLGEKKYYDETEPEATELKAEYGKALIASKFKGEISKKVSPVLIKSLYNLSRSTSPEIIADLREESAAVLEYSSLMSTLQVDYDGKKLPLSVVTGYLNDSERGVRKAAAEAIGNALAAKKDKLDGIFDRLVKLRHGIAGKLGYKNFTELAYYRMDRKDFDAGDVKKFRESVLKHVVPAVTELKERLKSDLNLETFSFYDNSVTMKEGEPKPDLDKDAMFLAAKRMYDDMDEEIGAFMRFMIETGAFDVEAREGKFGGGYCTEFRDYRQPFILANFNGTTDDVDVLTHEFGHAFAGFNAMQHGVYELNVGGMETAECHSMTMELLSHPYMDKFFGKDCDKYRYRHLFSCLDFLPYGVTVDEFQHEIYSHPDMTPDERNAEFKRISKKYMPYMTYDGIPYLQEGTRWQYQMHVYETPFYYIDYALAQTVALEFYELSLSDRKAALSAYIKFVKKGGSRTFKKLIEQAGLSSPFKPATLKSVTDSALRRLDEIKKTL